MTPPRLTDEHLAGLRAAASLPATRSQRTGEAHTRYQKEKADYDRRRTITFGTKS
jgi:hypothetical protein